MAGPMDAATPSLRGADPQPARRSTVRTVVAWMAVAVLVGAAVISSNFRGARDLIWDPAVPDEVRPATSRVASDADATTAKPVAQRSAPWWQTVTFADGAQGSTTIPITIDRRAIDWRVTWSCSSGHFQIRSTGQARSIVDADCPEGMGFSPVTGPAELEVTADGPWSVEIAQRINLPLVEPPLPVMTAPDAKVAATGTFRRAERTGVGTVTIYETDRGYSVRLDDFWVNPRSALQLRLSGAASPDTAAQYLAAESQLLASLDVTAGSLNYESPTGVDVVGFPSVVVWSPLDKTVYATAYLSSQRGT